MPFGVADKNSVVALCDCCSPLVMNKFCWLLRRSQEGVTGLVELWPQNTKPAHQCRWSRALPLANHVSDVVGKKKKKLPFSSRVCASYTLNYPMMTLQMQHMPLWPQVPITVISSAFHQSFSAAGSRHSVLGPSCSPKPRTPALHPLLSVWKTVSSRKLTSLLMRTPYSWVNWKAWLMFTMQPAHIRGILPNALAEVIPKIIIRQFLRAIHGLKWHFPQVTSLMGVSFTQHVSI